MDTRGRRASAQPRPQSKNKDPPRRRPGSSSSVTSGRSGVASPSAAGAGASRPSASPPAASPSAARPTKSALDFQRVRARIELEARQAVGSDAGPLALGEYLLLRSFGRDRPRRSSCSSGTEEAAEPPRRRLDPDEVWRRVQAEEEEKRAKEARRLRKKELWKPRGARIEKRQKQ